MLKLLTGSDLEIIIAEDSWSENKYGVFFTYIHPKLVVCGFVHWLDLWIGLELSYSLAFKIW